MGKVAIEVVTLEQGREIAQDRMPLGQFMCPSNGFYYAIENESGDAWIEQFNTVQQCINYLSK